MSLGSPAVIPGVACRTAAGLLWVVPIEEDALHAQVAGQYEACHRRVPAIVPNLTSFFIA